jgi:hypothetical protein
MVCVHRKVAAQGRKHYAKAIGYTRNISFDLDVLVDLYRAPDTVIPSQITPLQRRLLNEKTVSPVLLVPRDDGCQALMRWSHPASLGVADSL